jgi:hypothetical protein
MENKRSIGVTIFAILIIVPTVLVTAYSLTPKAIAVALEYYLKPYGIIFYISGIILSLFEIIIGINILRLKQWARKSLIILMIVYIGYLFLTPLFKNKEFVRLQEKSIAQSEKMRKSDEKAMAGFEEKIKNLPPEQQEAARLKFRKFLETTPRVAILVATVIMYGIFFLWYLLLIFFFTRPKIKEQFR